MPKRKNPFGDYTPQQLKTHVGFKETAREEDMQEVYARTRALLFQGANPGVNLLPSLLNGSSQPESPAECSLQPKQNGASPSKGGLMKYFSNGSTAGSDGGKPTKSAAQAELCVCCRSNKGVQPGCSFCDHRVCSGCLEVCCVCEGLFCRFCSVRNYDESQVRSFCLNCLPTLS